MCAGTDTITAPTPTFAKVCDDPSIAAERARRLPVGSVAGVEEFSTRTGDQFDYHPGFAAHSTSGPIEALIALASRPKQANEAIERAGLDPLSVFLEVADIGDDEKIAALPTGPVRDLTLKGYWVASFEDGNNPDKLTTGEAKLTRLI